MCSVAQPEHRKENDILTISKVTVPSQEDALSHPGSPPRVWESNSRKATRPLGLPRAARHASSLLRCGSARTCERRASTRGSQSLRGAHNGRMNAGRPGRGGRRGNRWRGSGCEPHSEPPQAPRCHSNPSVPGQACAHRAGGAMARGRVGCVLAGVAPR